MGADWYLRLNGTESGPFSSPQLRELADQGRIAPNTEVRRGQDGKWVSATRVRGIFPDTHRVEEKGDPSALLPSKAVPTSEPNFPIIIPTALPVARDTDSEKSPAFVWALIGGAGVFLVCLFSFAIYTLRENAADVARAPKPNNQLAEAGAREVREPIVSISPGSGIPREEVVKPSNSKFPFTQPTNAKVLSSEEVVALCEPSVALIKGRFSSGTGFLVLPGVIATNKHVIDCELIQRMSVYFPSAPDGKTGPFPAELLFRDQDRDLAFLSVQSKLPALRIAANYSFRRGQEVIVIGSPGVGKELVLENAVSRGVMSTRATIRGQDYYQLGISINPGNSGGPVFDMSGQVIGVVTLKASEEEGMGFCIPLPLLQDSVARLLKLSKQDIDDVRSEHRLRAVFSLVNTACELYSAAIQAYTLAMEYALDRGASVNLGLQAAQNVWATKLSLYDEFVVRDLEQQVAQISKDPRLPNGTRERFVDFWTNYIEMKSYVDDPRGNYQSYKAKSRELLDTHDRLSRSLNLLLGIDND